MKLEKILVATNNEHKITEYKNIFKNTNIKILCPKDLGIEIDPEENGATYKENATIKASSFYKIANIPTISDDSGIEIDEIGEHQPGIHSHRFIDEHGGRDKTLEFITTNYLGSKSRFHCSIVLVGLENEPIEFIGEVEGHISKIVKMSGFGYDPIFLVDSVNKTYSELGIEEKDKLSHRALAAEKLLSYLKEKSYI